jgi:hypothetical protein
MIRVYERFDLGFGPSNLDVLAQFDRVRTELDPVLTVVVNRFDLVVYIAGMIQRESSIRILNGEVGIIKLGIFDDCNRLSLKLWKKC